jgi:hypothetical protein
MLKKRALLLAFCLVYRLAYTQAPTNVGNICTPAIPPSGMLSITAYGAVSGGSATTNTTALTNCNSAANTAGKSCLIPPGNYAHNAYTWTGPAGLYGLGSSSILTGSSDTACEMLIAGNNGTLSNYVSVCPQTTRDGLHWNIFFNRTVSGWRMDSVEVQGGDAGGVINFFATNGTFTNNYFHDTLADCLYTTDGSSNMIVANNKARNCGDDSLSNVSMIGDADGIVSNVLDQANDVGFQSNGRGLSVVGGQHITMAGNLVQSTTQNAGIYLADEPSFNTHTVSDVVVIGNYLSAVSGSTGQPGIFAYAGQNTPGVTGVDIESNTVVNAVHDAVGINPTGGTIVNLKFVNNTLTTPGGTGMINQGSAGTNIYCSGNTLNGSATAPGGVCNGTNTFTPTGSSLTWSGCIVPGAPISGSMAGGIMSFASEEIPK